MGGRRLAPRGLAAAPGAPAVEAERAAPSSTRQLLLIITTTTTTTTTTTATTTATTITNYCCYQAPETARATGSSLARSHIVTRHKLLY